MNTFLSPTKPSGPARRTCWGALAAMLSAALLTSGCTTTALVISLASAATDTSVPLHVARHVHDQWTEGDPVPCRRLNSVQAALSGRCGAFVAGSLQPADVAAPGLPVCPLTLATRDPALWPVLDELIARGARPEQCRTAPLVALAQTQTCAGLPAVTPAARRSLEWLAEQDPRSVQHDVVRMLSCPAARAAGLDQVLVGWADRGRFEPGSLPFGPLGALHPDYLQSALARDLEARGHTAQAALGSHDARLPGGFEEALRTSHWQALDWWLVRVPELVNRVPPNQGDQLPWLPLARVLVPSFLADPDSRPRMIEFLMARGADPWKRLPFDADRTVIAYARSLKSPLVALLDPPRPSRAQAAAVVVSPISQVVARSVVASD